MLCNAHPALVPIPQLLKNHAIGAVMWGDLIGDWDGQTEASPWVAWTAKSTDCAVWIDSELVSVPPGAVVWVLEDRFCPESLRRYLRASR
jgi:hypothetical protein